MCDELTDAATLTPVTSLEFIVYSIQNKSIECGRHNRPYSAISQSNIIDRGTARMGDRVPVNTKSKIFKVNVSQDIATTAGLLTTSCCRSLYIFPSTILMD